jgi:hypothetical protein
VVTVKESGWDQRLRQIARIAEGLLLGAALVVIAACGLVLWVLVTDPERGEEWTSGLRPVQFYKELDAELLDDYAGVFVVAHNSGDSVGTTLEALAFGADVVEVDVVSLHGQLYAAHDTPSTWIGDNLFRGPPLERVWIAAASAEAIKLDLKEATPAFHELVLQFLAERRGHRRVIVVSGDPRVLSLFAAREPAVLRFLGVSTDTRFGVIEDDPELADLIDGVSVRHTLIDEERAAWLEERRILTLAWTVNDLSRVNELVLLGVDAITTNNLAIMKLLGAQLGDEHRLDRLPQAPAPTEEATPFSPVLSAPGLAGLSGQQPHRAETRHQRHRARPKTAGHRRASQPTADRPGRSWRPPQT